MFEILFLFKKKEIKMRDPVLDGNTAFHRKFKCLIVSLQQEDDLGKDSVDTELIVETVGPRDFHESEHALRDQSRLSSKRRPVGHPLKSDPLFSIALSRTLNWSQLVPGTYLVCHLLISV